MPIEFQCPQCSKLLRTPDESAGKRAKCPQCSAIVNVPEADAPAEPSTESATVPDNPFAPSTDSPASGVNPYASPTAAARVTSASQAKGDLRHTTITFDEIFNSTWNLFRENLGEFALLGVVLFGINFGLQMIAQAIQFAAEVSGETAAIALAGVVTAIFNMGVQAFLAVGSVIYVMKLVRTRQVQINELFAGGPYFVRAVCLSLLIALLVVGVIGLCGLPALAAWLLEMPPEVWGSLIVVGVLVAAVVGTFLWLRYLLCFYFLVDRGTNVFESLHDSARFMQGNRLHTLLLLIVTGFVSMLLVCCCGQILTVPFTKLLLCVIYLTATGQAYRAAV